MRPIPTPLAGLLTGSLVGSSLLLVAVVKLPMMVPTGLLLLVLVPATIGICATTLWLAAPSVVARFAPLAAHDAE